jgi:hypothetical protein
MAINPIFRTRTRYFRHAYPHTHNNIILLLLLPSRARPLACANSELIGKFESCRQSVGFLGQGISPLQGRYQHMTTQTQNKHRQTFVPRVGFESTIPVFGRAKTFHALDRATTRTIGLYLYDMYNQKVILYMLITVPFASLKWCVCTSVTAEFNPLPFVTVLLFRTWVT